MLARTLFGVLLMLYASAFVLYRGWLAAGLRRPWWLQALNTLAPWIFAPALALPALGPWQKSPIYWALALLAAGLYVQRYLWFLGHKRSRGELVPQLTLLTCNLLKDNHDCDRLVQALSESGADVIALQELRLEQALPIDENLSALYPYRWLIPGQDDEGMGIISRYPLLQCRLRQPDPGAIPTQIVSLTAGERRLTLINAHTRIPVLETHTVLGQEWPCGLDVTERRADLRHLVGLAAEQSGDLVVMGDLNLTDEESDYGLIPTDWRNAFRLRGRHPGLTYPVRVDFFGLFVPFPLFRIDHVFCRNEWDIRSARTIRLPGSDHRGLIVQVGWPRK